MTDVKQAALQQALEAIEKFVASELTVGQRYTNPGQGLLDAIDAMRAALAAPQPAQEPECERCGEAPRMHTSAYWCDNQSFRLPDGSTQLGCTTPQAPQPLTGGDERRHVICLCPDCIKPAQEPVSASRDVHSHMMLICHRAMRTVTDNGKKYQPEKVVIRAICKAIQADKNLLAKLAAPQRQLLTDEATNALEVIQALDSGEWELMRHQPCSFLTDEANRNGAWSVSRQQAPYCSTDGVRRWFGSSASEALRKGMAAITSKGPAA